MKVKELIEILKKENQESRVVVDGYESGYDETYTITKVKIRINPYHGDEKYDKWYDGEFDLSKDEDAEVAVLIPRKS